jgi:solute carrier family 25 phosphate transporter 23/24/25/41
MPSHTTKDLSNLKDIFHKHDVDSSNSIAISELSAALSELKVPVPPSDLVRIVSEYDADKSGELSFSEFCSIFDKAKLRIVFDEIDDDGSGQVSTEELVGAMEALGHKLSPGAVREIMGKVDADNSGQISYAEFEEFFKYVPAASLASIASVLLNLGSVDCGSDLSPPIPSPDVPWYYGVLGGLGGVVSRTLTAPLEKVKLVAQTSSKSVSILNELKTTYRALGFKGLFAGNAANCVRVFPMAGIVTYVYLNALKLTPADNDLDPMEPVYRGMCAATAGIVGQLFTYPIDVVRAQLSVNPEKHKSVLGTATTIAKEGGTAALYRGLVPTLMACAPFLACQMATADALKSYMSTNDIELTTGRMMLVGGTAGIVGQSVVYPLDVLRRRMQVGAASANASVISDSTWVALQQVVRKEGFRTLFSGIVPTYLKVFPAVAIAMTTTKELIGKAKEMEGDGRI